jgi:predicted DNA-binding transcriptional regulator YafY
MIHGTRDEQAFRRRLAILVLLHARPHTAQQIRAALAAQDLLDPADLDDPDRANRLRYQFRHDLDALNLAGYEIHCDRRSQTYRWRNSPFGLALTEPQLFALGVLRDTFADSTILHGAEIRDLLDQLARLLPPDQQTALARKRRPYRLDLRETTDYRAADPRTVADIERAIRDGQQLDLTYRSSREGIERRHTVEPRPLIYKNGHVYLPVYNVVIHREFDLRLDNIVPGSTRVLPQYAAPGRPLPPSSTLRYRLSPAIARHHVSDHFSGQRVERHADGSATVTAEITDLFAARRLLLGYGEQCEVLSPPELIADMRATAAALYSTYCSAEK